MTASDLQTKHRIVPGRETVQLIGKHPEMAAFDVSDARKRPIKKSGGWSQGIQFDVDKCVWILPTERLNYVVPQRGDWITESDETHWVIEDIDSGLQEAEFKCLCVKARVNE